ncbi:MAG: PQQ-binding-like beta-propeller repeat protein [Lewinellaceae bacterium]|nr:PQQ-binding-like beta-propeller repeat protein [Phaeodactylibacter sp.]MCB9351308.1 PQQ-binding-like beta-propeller repeat protein [Lewinellaceae bacterium]
MEEYPKVYWTDPGLDYAIYRKGPADPGKVPVVPAMQEPFDIKVDQNAGKVYWSDLGANKILRANLDGSELEALITGEDPYFIDLDLEAGMVYWTKEDETGICRASISAGPNPPVEDVVSGSARARGLVLDIHAGKVYWTSASGTIYRADLKENNPDNTWEPFLSGQGELWGLTIDLWGGMLYWVSGSGASSRIRQRPLTGGYVFTLPIALNGGRGITIDLLAGRLYWAEAGGERIGSSDFNGQDDSYIPLGGRHPIGGLAWDPMTAHLFWPGANGRVYRKRFPDNEFDTLAYPTSRPEGIAVDSVEKRIYWIQHEKEGEEEDHKPYMLSVNTEGREWRQLNYDGEVDKYLSLRQDPAEVFWQETGRIMRSGRQGNNSSVVFSGLRSPHHIVVNSTLGLLFWLDTFVGLWGIIVNVVRGAGVDWVSYTNLVRGLSSFIALAVDGERGKIFWVQFDGIHSSGIDGNGDDLIILRQKVTNLEVDEKTGKLYWSQGDAPNMAIHRSNPDGTSEEVVISGVSVVAMALEVEV